MVITSKAESTCKKKTMVNVRFRLFDGRHAELWVKSEIKVDIRFWDNENECYRNVKASPYTLTEQKIAKDAVALRKMKIEEVYLKLKDKNIRLTSKIFNEYVEKFIKYGSFEELKVNVLTDQLGRYIIDRRFSKTKVKSINTLINSIKRYERYVSHIKHIEYTTYLKDVNKLWLKDFQTYFENELEIIKDYPELYVNDKEVRYFSIRTENYVIEIMGYIRRFWNWALNEELVNDNPFAKYKLNQPVYEDPIVMTKNEVYKLYSVDLDDEDLDLVRSIFLFKYSIGSRPGELDSMTKEKNLIELEEDGEIIKAVEYTQPKVAKKTKRKPATPLNALALEMMNKYYFTTERVMPKISSSSYSKKLKQVFEIAGIDRKVLVMNKETGEYERKPLYMLASPQMARRTFLSHAVNSGADKSVYTSITGHKINTPHLDRYIFVQPTTKKKLLDEMCDMIRKPAQQSKLFA
jgi:site-specific recombinase XerD